MATNSTSRLSEATLPILEQSQEVPLTIHFYLLFYELKEKVRVFIYVNSSRKNSKIVIIFLPSNDCKEILINNLIDYFLKSRQIYFLTRLLL
jgi:hypothetical protein